jgi:hypothetical protein
LEQFVSVPTVGRTSNDCKGDLYNKTRVGTPVLTLVTTIPGLFLQLPPDSFAFFYGRNGSAICDRVFNVETGAEDIPRLGDVRHWQYSKSIHCSEGGSGQVRCFFSGKSSLHQRQT